MSGLHPSEQTHYSTYNSGSNKRKWLSQPATRRDLLVLLGASVVGVITAELAANKIQQLLDGKMGTISEEDQQKLIALTEDAKLGRYPDKMKQMASLVTFTYDNETGLIVRDKTNKPWVLCHHRDIPVREEVIYKGSKNIPVQYCRSIDGEIGLLEVMSKEPNLFQGGYNFNSDMPCDRRVVKLTHDSFSEKEKTPQVGLTIHGQFVTAYSSGLGLKPLSEIKGGFLVDTYGQFVGICVNGHVMTKKEIQQALNKKFEEDGSAGSKWPSF